MTRSMTIIAMGTRTASASLVTRGSRGNIKVISPKITAAAIDHACMEHHHVTAQQWIISG
jgi:hypothetical protein